MLYFLFAVQQWLGPIMLVSLTVAAFAAYRSRPASWSLLFLIAASFMLAGVLGNSLALGAFRN